MKNLLKPIIFSIIACVLCSCQTFHGMEGDISSLFVKQTQTDQKIQASQAQIADYNQQKIQIVSNSVFEAQTALKKDPTPNLYNQAADRVLDNAVVNLPPPSPDGIQKAQARLAIALNPDTFKNQDATNKLLQSYKDDLTASQQIILAQSKEEANLKQLNQQKENDNAKIVANLQTEVNNENAKIQAQEQARINLIFSGIGGACVLAGILLIAFTSMKLEGALLIGLGICIAPIGLFYSSPWFKWISGIGFGALFIAVIVFIIRAFGKSQGVKTTENLNDILIDSLNQFKAANLDGYNQFKNVLDTNLNNNPTLKTVIDNRLNPPTTPIASTPTTITTTTPTATTTK